VRKAFMLARREIIEQYSDRASIIRALFLTLLPIVLLEVNRRQGARTADASLVVFAVQAALLPAATAINAAAGSFAAEKEAQTIVPLLATPIRDFYIVAGKLLGVLVPAAVLSALSLIAFYAAASQAFGVAEVARVLEPITMAKLFALSVFFILTIGAWVMVVSARAPTQRAAQQIAGLVLAGLVIGVTAVGSLVQSIRTELVVGVIIAVALSDLGALELARRLWNREEAVARL